MRCRPSLGHVALLLERDLEVLGHAWIPSERRQLWGEGVRLSGGPRPVSDRAWALRPGFVDALDQFRQRTDDEVGLGGLLARDDAPGPPA